VISILVPTLGRPQALPPLLESVRIATPVSSYEVLFVCDDDDAETHRTIHSIGGFDHRIVVANGTYPQKTNAGYRAAEGELILPTADDVRFHPGWYAEALKMFSKRIMVVGTNDLAPEQDGTNITMPIIRRSYIEDPGCTVDEAGVVFSEHYHHNFVETEVWQLATYRGVAKYAKRSVIEHLHPDWGKREEDATDAKGCRTNWDADLELYRERMAAWG
jgi:glycosyltransferase involved in cell wall biosynthesis